MGKQAQHFVEKPGKERNKEKWARRNRKRKAKKGKR